MHLTKSWTCMGRCVQPRHPALERSSFPGNWREFAMETALGKPEAGTCSLSDAPEHGLAWRRRRLTPQKGTLPKGLLPAAPGRLMYNAVLCRQEA